jgi:hypothetical protein
MFNRYSNIVPLKIFREIAWRALTAADEWERLSVIETLIDF